MKKNANPAATVAAWNSAYPAGTEVNYRSHRHATPKRTRTTTEAQVRRPHRCRLARRRVWLRCPFPLRAGLSPRAQHPERRHTC